MNEFIFGVNIMTDFDFILDIGNTVLSTVLEDILFSVHNKMIKVNL